MEGKNRLHPPGKPNMFGRPQGFLGMVAGWIMGRAGVGNNKWAVSKVDVQPGDSILEVGFGPGVGIHLLAERARGGFVAGVDPSQEMLGQASARNAGAIGAGRVSLQIGGVSALPFAERMFDKVLSVNNVMLWPDPEQDLREVRRVMKPGGMIVIALWPMWAKVPDEVSEMGEQIIAYLCAAEFTQAHMEMRTDRKPAGAVVVLARA